MIYMALAADRIVAQREIAKAFSMSEHHLAKVMPQLRRVGFIVSIRGPSGGFRLNVDPADLTLLAIHETIVGRESLRVCLFGRDACQSNCPLGSFICGLDAQLINFLEKTHLADVMSLVAVNT